MKPGTFTILFYFLLCKFLYAQDKELELHYNCAGGNAIFTKVNVIDERATNQTLGFVQVGGFNRIANVSFKGSLVDSLANYFLDKNFYGKREQEITIILYEFYLSELTEGLSETGRFKLSLRLFEKLWDGTYVERVNIDSAFMCTAMDVTKKLLHSVDEQFCMIAGLAAKANNHVGGETPHYTMEELKQLDKIEKKLIPIYNAAEYTAGIFQDYDQFKANAPDTSTVIIIDTGNTKRIGVYKWDKVKNKKIRLSNEDVYAVSDGKVLLKATAIGFYKLTKIDNDFYYAGQTSFTNSFNVALWGAMFGVVGALAASNSERNDGQYWLKINYVSGSSIPIGKVAKK